MPPTAALLDSLTLGAAADPTERVHRLIRHTLGAAAHVHLTPPTATVPGRTGAPYGDHVRELCEEVIGTSAALLLSGAEASTSPARYLTEPAIAFLGVPIRGAGKVPLGCLCAVDDAPRHWTPEDAEVLADLAALLVRDLEPRSGADEIRQLENLVRMLGKAVENMQLGVTVTDMSGRIIYINPADARTHGYEVTELVGAHARIFGPPGQVRTTDAGDISGATSWTRETVNVTKDGSRFPVLLWSDLVTDVSGSPIAVVTCCEDITERKQTEQALRDLALRDPLTELPNRIYFLDRLNLAIQGLQQDPGRGFAVLFLDLDRFKVVNDSLGHHVGDRLLCIVAQRLRESLRPSDTVARFGGDEFAVLLGGIQGLCDAKCVAERILTSLARPIHLDGYELFTSASIGIALGAEGLEQPEYLWRSADMAMYRAKGAGTGRYEVFDRGMHAEALTRLQLETDLRHAIERAEFRLHYQPVVDIQSGEIVGFEALLRWEHPLRGLVQPMDIIPLAEETGLILPLGVWVIEEACRQLAFWQKDAGCHEELWISVNLSGKQLTQLDLVEAVERALHASGITPGSLKLEITESAIVENTEQAANTLSALKALGVQLLMDDFGTGYSSLGYLHRLPLDALKIDRSFISRMVRGDQHSRLVETIVKLAQSVQVHVVGEGVTTADQLAILRELGCQLAQGFYFSHPLPLEEAQALLASGRTW